MKEQAVVVIRKASCDMVSFTDQQLHSTAEINLGKGRHEFYSETVCIGCVEEHSRSQLPRPNSAWGWGGLRVCDAATPKLQKCRGLQYVNRCPYPVKRHLCFWLKVLGTFSQRLRMSFFVHLIFLTAAAIQKNNWDVARGETSEEVKTNGPASPAVSLEITQQQSKLATPLNCCSPSPSILSLCKDHQG